MRISIIIPCHNEEKEIENTLRSIESQTVKPHETIVVCNGCTDRTVEISKLRPVKTLVTKRKGLNFARNYGAKRAAGEVLLFVDADTRLAPNFIKALQAAVAGRKRFLGSARNVPDDSRYWPYFWIINAAVRVAKLASNGVVFCPKELYEQAGGWPMSDPIGFEVFFIKAIRRLGGVKHIHLNKTHMVGSTRRFRKEGVIKPTLQWLSVPLRRDLKRMDYDNSSLR